MTDPSSPRDPDSHARPRFPLPPGALAGFLIAFVAVIASAAVTFRTLEVRSSTAQAMASTLGSLAQLKQVVSALQDAESGQRGYLLTGAESYLAPYTVARAALPDELAQLHAFFPAGSPQGERLATLERFADDKLAEMEATVRLRRAGRTRPGSFRPRRGPHGPHRHAGRRDRDGTRAEVVALSVTNAGTIPAETLPRIFDPFRGRADHGGSGQGLGLGIYIVQQIVRAHGGTVTVRSGDGPCTVFRAELPRRGGAGAGRAPTARRHGVSSRRH